MTTPIEKKRLTGRQPDKVSVPEERRCTHLHPDGRRCQQRRWRNKEVCYHHDPEAAEQRKNRARAVSWLGMISGTEVHALLARVIDDLRANRIKPGQAYAVGYLAELLLRNYHRMAYEYDKVKSNWERWREIGDRVHALDIGTHQLSLLGEEDEEEEEESEKSAGDAASPEAETSRNGQNC
ncbi:MAG TPA: hypothetical protein VNN18_13250 [Candidatus Xenobia bacterium]|nr:hypothetical protein [Candidatus Xenobia bacterium]